MGKRIISIIMCLCIICGTADLSMQGIDAQAAKRVIKFNKKTVSIEAGKSVTLKITVNPAKLKSKITYQTSKKKVATVSSKGRVKGVSEGVAKITAKVRGAGLKAECSVIVFSSSNNRKDNKKDNNKKNNNNTSGAPSVTWPPSGTDVSTWPQTGVAPTATAAAPEAGVVPPVATAPGPSEISFGEGEVVTVEIGETYKLQAGILPLGTDINVQYTSERDWVASVDQNGNVTAKYPGMTIVTATSKVDPRINAGIQVRTVDTSVPDETFDDYKSDIAHGTVVTITYDTFYREKGKEEARVWLPADYSKDGDTKYNVLYCLHGGGGNMWYWTNDNGGTNDGCRADKILDNMYAEGLIEPCIVVFPNGSMPYERGKHYENVPDDAVVTEWGEDCFLLEYEIIYNLMPYMSEHYNVAEGPEHTAVCGLSMGGGQTLDIGLKNPDLFAYVGCFSASPFAGDEQTLVTSYEDADRLNSMLKMFTLMVGSEDGMANNKNDSNAKKFIDVCNKYELNNMFIEEPGLAHEDACWDRNLYKFMKYAFK